MAKVSRPEQLSPAGRMLGLFASGHGQISKSRLSPSAYPMGSWAALTASGEQPRKSKQDTEQGDT